MGATTATSQWARRLRGLRESIHFDPDAENERDPAFIAAQLRGDAAFRGPRGTRRHPFDADRVESVITHVQAGSEPKARPADIRRAFLEGSAGSEALDAAIVSVLSEFDRPDLKDILQWSGATAREAAAFFRSRGGFGWSVVWCLNAMSDKGPRDLPWAMEKIVLAGHYDYMGR